MTPPLSKTSDAAWAIVSVPCWTVGDTRRPVAVDENTRHVGAHPHDEVGPLHRRPQIPIGTRPAAAVAAGDLICPRTDLACAVEVVVAGQAPFRGGVHPSVRQLVSEQPILDMQWAVGAMEWRPEAAVVLGLDEVGQHAVVVPSDIAALAPPVEVGAVSPDVDHQIDR